jgi:hypothetical protein
MSAQPGLPGVPAEEARRNQQIGVKLSELEKAKLAQAAAAEEMELAAWCRQTLLNVASGARAGERVEVPVGDLSALQGAVENAVTIAVANLSVLLEHVHHGDPAKHEDEEIARRGRRRSAEKMAKLMPRLGLNGLTEIVNRANGGRS